MSFYTTEKLRLNGYVKAVLPNTKDLYSRCGKRAVEFNGSSDSMPMSFNKQEALEYMDGLDRQRMREEDYARYAEEQKRLASANASDDAKE